MNNNRINPSDKGSIATGSIPGSLRGTIGLDSGVGSVARDSLANLYQDDN